MEPVPAQAFIKGGLLKTVKGLSALILSSTGSVGPWSAPLFSSGPLLGTLLGPECWPYCFSVPRASQRPWHLCMCPGQWTTLQGKPVALPHQWNSRTTLSAMAATSQMSLLIFQWIKIQSLSYISSISSACQPTHCGQRPPCCIVQREHLPASQMLSWAAALSPAQGCCPCTSHNPKIQKQ